MRALLAALAVLSPLVADAAELPAAFLGTWRVANPTDSACKPAVSGAPEGHIVVKPGLIEQYESSCRILSMRPTRKAAGQERVSVEAALACSGESMRWRDRTLWHLETVDGRTLLALTTLASDLHNERGRRVKGRDLPMTTIYAACG